MRVVIDLFCGLGGWSEGCLSEGYDVIGFDIERHTYGESRYPAQLVLQDVLTVHGSQFRNAALIVASPPCQNYSYLAMPWSRSEDPENSKAAKALRKKWETEGPDNRLFDACFRIQREAIAATGKPCPACTRSAFPYPVCLRCGGTGAVDTRYIPMVVENVRGAQPWVGRSRANYGSFHLWGDVETIGNRIQAGSDIGKFGAGLKVPGRGAEKVPGFRFDGSGRSFQTASVNETGQKANPDGTNHPQGSWFRIADSSQGDRKMTKCPTCNGCGYRLFPDLAEDGLDKQECMDCGGTGRIDRGSKGERQPGNNSDGSHVEAGGTKIGGDWFSDPNSTCRKDGSKSNARKAASAMISKIPFPLSSYIARAFK